ncbi:MAG: toxin, partial [Oscillospiraceae bacterium]|nr:toxin [Oscillospiraceae bacterium]
MDSYDIYRQAKALIEMHGTKDPVKLARHMGILLYDEEKLTDLLGMYTYRWKHRIIIMNPHINEILYRMVVAHEIGHDQRH